MGSAEQKRGEWPSRDEFPVTASWAYLSHQLRGPLPARTASRLREMVDDFSSQGAKALPRWQPEAGRARGHMARLMGASASEISFARNTSDAISLVANGLALGPGDRVITNDLEYPANIYPWWNLRDRGVEVVCVASVAGRVPVEALEQELRRGAAVLALSWVEFSTGFRNDLAVIGRLCEDHGVLLVVDAVQGLGALKMDVERWRVPVVAADARKWLLGLDGLGILYCRADVRERIRVPVVGAASVQNSSDYLDYDLALLPDSRRFECGALNTPGCVALAESTELLLEVGPERIERRVLALTERLCERLNECGASVTSPRQLPEERSGIVTWRVASGRPEQLREAFERERLAVNVAADGTILASPHFYNTFEEVERAAEVSCGVSG